jgi:hypothetical protein
MSRRAPIVARSTVRGRLIGRLASRHGMFRDKRHPWVFSSFRSNATHPHVANMLVEDYLRPTAVKAGTLSSAITHPVSTRGEVSNRGSQLLIANPGLQGLACTRLIASGEAHAQELLSLFDNPVRALDIIIQVVPRESLAQSCRGAAHSGDSCCRRLA